MQLTICYRTFILSILLLFPIWGLKAQNFNFSWAHAIGSYNDDGGNSIAVDAAGNVYITGYFEETVDFDPGVGTSNLVSQGEYDVYIAKYDANGNLLWANSFGGTGSEEGRHLLLDGSGNIYVCGYFNNTVDFDPGVGTANQVSNGFQDAFLAKYDSNGNYIWAQSFGGSFFEDANAIGLDASGNVFICGFYEDDVDFDPGLGSTLKTSEGGYDIYLSKFDNNGNFVWVDTYGSFGNDVAEDLKVDASNNIFLTGYFEATVDFDPGAGTLNLTSAGLEDIFFTRIDNNGNVLWANRIGSFNTDIGSALDLDLNNQLVLGGTFYDIVDFDPGAGTSNLTNNDFLENIFFAKYTTNGALVWAKSMGGNSIEQVNGVHVDAQDNIFLTGNFLSTADFDPSLNVANLSSNGSFDMFFAKYDSNGNYKWAHQLGGNSFDQGLNITLDEDGNIYSTGFFQSFSMDLDPSTGIQSVFNSGLNDLFISKLDGEAEIAIFGNGQEIANGDVSPALSDYSDYGRVAINTVKTQTFSIKNLGFTGLFLQSPSPNFVNISGDAEFSIQQQPSDSLILEGDSLTFQVAFSPTLPGIKTATISISNSDSDESVYTFLVQATGSNIGPGGVSDSLKLWLRADLGVTESSGLVSAWEDQSINQYDLNNSNSVAYVANQFNFNPSLFFDAEDDLIYSSADLEAQSAFIFQQMDNFLGQSNATFFSYFGADQGYFGRRAGLTGDYDFPGDATNWFTSNPRRNGKNMTGTETILLGEADILFGESNSGVRTTKQAVGGSFDTRTPQGYVPELVVYNDPLTALEKQQVETYLALKYGLTLDQSAGQDYYASDGTIIWDYSEMGTFTHDVIGIGRDDLSAWSQKQSRSYNSDDNLSIAIGYFATDNLSNVTSFSRDRTYLLCSNNNGSTLYSNRVTSQLLNASTESRSARVWKVEENMGDVGTINLMFNMSSTGFPGTTAQEYALLVSNSPTDFSAATLYLANQYNSGIVDFQGINLTDGQYFTIAHWIGQTPSAVSGEMLDFDGTGDYVSIPDNSAFDFGTGALTVEMWFKKSNSGQSDLFSWRNNAGDELSIFIGSDNTLKVYVETDLTFGYQPIFGNQELTTNNWYHIAVVKDATGNWTSYVNGTFDESDWEQVDFNDFDTGTPIWLGARNNNGTPSNELEGNIDEVRIWNVERSQLQIRLNMHLILQGDESGLVAYYQFNDDEPAGTPLGVKDVLNSKNGTTQGNTAYELSEVAVAQGLSHSITVNNPGNYVFGQTGLEIGFGAAPNGDIVVSSLFDLPYNTPTDESGIENKYWVVNNYGDNENLAAIVTCNFSDTAFLLPQNSLYTLHKRASTAFGSWDATINPASGISDVSGNKHLTFTGIDEFSQLYPTLPTVSLQNQPWVFEAESQSSDCYLLNWQAPSDQDLQYYELEKGANPQALSPFIKVGQQHTYKTKELHHSLYYRVKQVNRDGGISYSPILFLASRAGAGNDFEIEIYPNPFVQEVSIRTNAIESKQKIHLDLMTAQGKLLLNFVEDDLGQINQKLNTYIQNVPGGIYLLRLRKGQHSKYRRLIKR